MSMSRDFLAQWFRYVKVWWYFVVPVLVWMGVIFLLSSQPAFGTGSASLSLGQFLLRKGAHVVEYFVLGVLLFRMFRYFFSQSSHMTAAGVVLVSLPFALSDEIHQLFVSGRQGRVSDVGIDAIGIFLSLIFCLVILPWWRKKETQL